MKRSNQKGSALIFALIFILVLSVSAASLMFLSQSETWASLNYRLMTQSRYGAEAGINATANYIMFQYTLPGGGADPITAYTYQDVSPVTVGGTPVFLSSLHGVSANYPVGAVQTAFNTASSGSLTSSGNNVNVTYSSSAELMSMRQIIHCGNAQPITAQTWKITSHGDITGVRNAESEVTALLETQVVPCYMYAAFATSSGCGAINWSGGGPIDSYDSSNLGAGTQAYDGNLGSNGNINTAPHTTINGTFSSPDTGVGLCSAGDALTGSLAQVTGCETAAQVASNSCGTPMIKLPQSVIYPPPNTAYPPTVTFPAGFLALPTTSNGTISPGNYGDISLHGHDTLTFLPQVDPVTHVCSSGVYNINTISESGNNTSVNIGACPAGSTPAGAYMPLIINLVGVNSAGVPLPAGSSVLSLSGNSVINPTLDPRLFQIQYSGYGNITVTGNSQSGGLVYAPNAAVTLSGANSAWYGALIGATVLMNGNGAAVHYDRRLNTDLMTVSNWTLDTFTWSKF